MIRDLRPDDRAAWQRLYEGYQAFYGFPDRPRGFYNQSSDPATVPDAADLRVVACVAQVSWGCACFVQPRSYANQLMVSHGGGLRYEEGTRDPDCADPRRRAELLESLQAEIIAAPIDPASPALLGDTLDVDFVPAHMGLPSPTNGRGAGNVYWAGR